MTRRAFLKWLALLCAAPFAPRLAWSDTQYWILDVSALGVDTFVGPPDSPPVFRLWMPYVV